MALLTKQEYMEVSQINIQKRHTGDIITAVDRHPIVRSDDLISYIDQHKSVGDSVTLTVYRNGHTVDLKTILTARPSPLPFLPVDQLLLLFLHLLLLLQSHLQYPDYHIHKFFVVSRKPR